MVYEIKVKSNLKIPAKLQSVKAIKELTGLGLKESKNIIDNISDGLPQRINTLDSNNRFNIEILKNNNIEFGDSREDRLNDMLLKYKVNVISPQITYKILEGDVEVINGSVIMNIIEGEVIDHNYAIYSELKNDITNIKTTIDFSNVIIEEPI